MYPRQMGRKDGQISKLNENIENLMSERDKLQKELKGHQVQAFCVVLHHYRYHRERPMLNSSEIPRADVSCLIVCLLQLFTG
jgi:hypothetical protein